MPDYVDDGNQTSTVTVSVNDDSSDDDFDSVANQTVSVSPRLTSMQPPA